MTAHFKWFQTAYPALHAAKVSEKQPDQSVTIDCGSGVLFVANQAEDFERMRDACAKAVEAIKGSGPNP